MTTALTSDTGETADAITITSAELAHLIAVDPEVILFDVRTGSEFETAHISGSLHVPVDTMREHAGRFAEIGHDIVMVCQSGARASQAQEALAAAGNTSVRVLDGGIGAWISDGGDVVRGSEKWALDRQVRLVAGSLVLTGFALGRTVARPMVALSALVGGGLVFSAVSNTCALGNALGRLPYNRGPACDVDGILAATTKAR